MGAGMNLIEFALNAVGFVLQSIVAVEVAILDFITFDILRLDWLFPIGF